MVLSANESKNNNVTFVEKRYDTETEIRISISCQYDDLVVRGVELFTYLSEISELSATPKCITGLKTAIQ